MKDLDLNETGRRREFIRAAARYLALGAVTVVATVLARRRAAAPAGPGCVNDDLCRGCTAWATCSLPPADAARRAGVGG